jgi:DNA-binding transcriptional LysR family regulator
MRRLPSFSALRAFEAAARLGSFSLACRELHLTPSAISHQVRSLEDYFGRPLFIRRNRFNELTLEGRRLLVDLSPAFDAIEVAVAALMPDPTQKPFAIHCSPSFASQWLGPSLPDFVAQNPAISIRLTSGAESVDLLVNEEIDVAISYGAPLDRPGLVSESLGPEDIVALCTSEIATQFDADPSLLREQPLIKSTVSPVQWINWFAAHGIEPPPARAGVSFDRGALAIAAARQGLGVALETRRFAREDLATGKLVLLGMGRFCPISCDLHFLTYRVGQKNGALIAHFRSWLLAKLAGETTSSLNRSP